MGIADRAKKAEKFEHFVESYKLKHLKGEIILEKYKIQQKIICQSFKRPEMYVRKDLQQDEGRKVDKREEKKDEQAC